MYQVDWQEYEDIQEWSSEQFIDLEEALRFYKEKVECVYWVRLSQELLENINPNVETYAEVENNWKDNGGYEKQNEAMVNSFGIDDRPICPNCSIKMSHNHYVDEEKGRIFGHTCYECGFSKWDCD